MIEPMQGWKIEPIELSGYEIIDPSGNIRGRYHNSDTMAQHLVIVFQEIDRLQKYESAYNTAGDVRRMMDALLNIIAVKAANGNDK